MAIGILSFGCTISPGVCIIVEAGDGPQACGMQMNYQRAYPLVCAQQWRSTAWVQTGVLHSCRCRSLRWLPVWFWALEQGKEQGRNQAAVISKQEYLKAGEICRAFMMAAVLAIDFLSGINCWACLQSRSQGTSITPATRLL